MTRPEALAAGLEQPVAAVIAATARHCAGPGSAGGLPESLDAELARSGLCGMLLPGGLDVHPAAAFCAIEEVSRASGAAGTQLAWHNSNVLLAWLPPQARRGLGATTEAPVMAGSMSPCCTARLTSGRAAYRLTGSWPSRVDPGRANLIMAGFWDAAEPRIAFLPVTGELDVSRRPSRAGDLGGEFAVAFGDLSVPAEQTVRLSDAMLPGRPGASPPSHLLGATPASLTLALLAAVASGVSGASIDGFTALAKRKWQVTTRCPLDEDPVVSGRVRSAATAAAAARELMLRELLAQPAAAAGASTRAADVPGAAEHVISVAREVTLAMFELAGAGAVMRSSPLQRCLSDVQAIGQHVLLSGDRRISRALAHARPASREPAGDRRGS